MKKTSILMLLALGAIAPSWAQDEATTYPVPIERRVPWTIISGSDRENGENNPLGGKTGGIYDLIDRNPITFWHSDLSDDGRSETHNHWFMIDRGIGASNVPFNTLSIQQRVIQEVNPDNQSFNGAVKSADVYVTDEFIGLLGGISNKQADDETIYNYTQQGLHTPTLHIDLKAYTQEAQLFEFSETQTGRFVLVVIEHTINPNGTGNEETGKGNSDQYACLSEFNLFMDTPENRVTASNFDGVYALSVENPVNAQKANKRTHMLQFTFADAVTGETNDVNTDAYRMSPLLQSSDNPYIPALNWLDWDKTFFDITNLMTVSTGNGMKFQIVADGAGNGLYKALYIDWDENGFDAADKVIATANTVALNSTLEAVLTVDDSKLRKVYRARYIVDDQNSSPLPGENIADGGIIVDFSIKIEKPVTFNVNFKFEDKVVKTIEGVEGYANLPFILATPDFFDVDVVAVAPENDGDIDVNLRRFIGLPFMFADSYENIIWQAVQQNYSYKLGQTSASEAQHNFTWTYNPDNEAYMIESEPANVNTEGFADTQLWGFVGNFFDGFTIYNKAAGEGKCVYIDGNSIKLGAATDNNLWKAFYAPSRDNAKYCTFKTDASDYLSFATVSGNALGLNATANNAATCWFVAPSAPMLEQVADYTFDFVDAEEPANFPSTRPVGSYKFDPEADFAGFQQTIEDATANPYDYDLSVQLREVIDYYENNVEYITLQTNKWYRITAAHPANGWIDHFLHTNDGSNNIKGENIKATRKQNYFSLFNFVAVPDQEDRYYIQSQGKYIGHCNGRAAVKQVDTTADAGQFTLVDPNSGPAKFAIKDMTQSGDNICLHKGSEGTVNITGWSSVAGGSHFYILPADDVEVPLTATIADLGNVDFVTFPFAVKVGNDGSELYTLFAGYDNADTENPVPVLSYRKVASVAANTPCMVANSERTTATLLIDSEVEAAPMAARRFEAAAAAPADVLAGTIRSASAAAGDYTVSTANGSVSFVKQTTAPSIQNNYVYIPADNLSADHKKVDTLTIHDPAKTDATGIREITVGNSASQAVYDLQGRRLSAPQRGLNIVNGHKFLLK